MSLFKRPHSPFWQTEFQVEGTRVSRSTRTSSRREAERVERELREQIRRDLKQSAPKPTAALTIDQACGRYWIEHGSRLADHVNVKRYLLYATRYLDPLMLLGDLSNRHIAEFITTMRDAGIGDRAINHTVVCLQGVHNRAAKVWEEPVRIINWREHKTKGQSRTRWITPEIARELLDAMHPDTAEIVRFMLLTGVRKKEAFNLLADNIDYQNATATVIQKGGRIHVVELGPEALLLLQALPERGRYVFDTTNWRKRFEAAKQTIGLEDFRWHDLRHTAATWLGQSGASLDIIKEQLGHSSIAVTQKYRHVTRSEVRAALQRIPALSPSSDKIVPLKRG